MQRRQTCERVYSWGFFVVAINSRLPARRWHEKGKRDAPNEIVEAAEAACNGDRNGKSGERSKKGVGKRAYRGKAETAEGMRLHTPPRGLPHSDSPIRMSK